MNIKKALSKDCVLLHLKSDTKQAVIEEMLDALVSAGKIQKDRRDEVLAALMDRESKMSTGMQCGIAIPHCKTHAVSDLVVGLAVVKQGVDFNSLDGEPSRLFVMTISSLDHTGPHIQFLAEISRLLNDRTMQEKILTAERAEDVLDLL